MTRHLLTTVLAALAAVGVGAQSNSALQPSQRADLYKKNRPVIERLVGETIASSKVPNNHVRRADTYHRVLVDLNKAILQAKADKDADRVAELTKHLNALLDRGLKPTLDSAREQVRGGSGEAEYREVRVHLLAQVDALLNNLDDHPAVKAALEQTRASLNAEIRK